MRKKIVLNENHFIEINGCYYLNSAGADKVWEIIKKKKEVMEMRNSNYKNSQRQIDQDNEDGITRLTLHIPDDDLKLINEAHKKAGGYDKVGSVIEWIVKLVIEAIKGGDNGERKE